MSKKNLVSHISVEMSCATTQSQDFRFAVRMKTSWSVMVIPTVKLPGAAAYESHMSMHTSTSNTDISLARAFQKHLSEPTRAHS